MSDARVGPLVDVRYGDMSTLIDFEDIEAIVIKHTTADAYVRLITGRRVQCSNPVAVRDAWRSWKLQQAPAPTVDESVAEAPLTWVDRLLNSIIGR
jgi:hypothetical protein